MKSVVSTLALAAALNFAAPVAAQSAPTPAEAEAFVAEAERAALAFSEYGSRIAWVNATYMGRAAERNRKVL